MEFSTLSRPRGVTDKFVKLDTATNRARFC